MTSPTSGCAPDGARGRAPRPGPNTPTPRTRWSSPSTAAGGAARSAATPTASSPRCAPANSAALRSSSATTSTSSATCRATRHAWPASSGAANAERCCAAPPMTPIPTERVVVANADQLLIVVALADPPPRTGFVERVPDRRLRRRADPDPVPDQDRPGAARAVRRAVRRAGPDGRHRRAATTPLDAVDRPAHRQVDGAARPLRRRQVDAGESPSCPLHIEPSAWCRASARASTRRRSRWHCRCRVRAG